MTSFLDILKGIQAQLAPIEAASLSVVEQAAQASITALINGLIAHLSKQ